MENNNTQQLTGRKLDAAIEREVFGRYPHIHTEDYEIEYIGYVEFRANCLDCKQNDVDDLPEYSSDLNDAFKIVDHLAQQGIDLDLSLNNINKSTNALIYSCYLSGKSKVTGKAISLSAAEAICLATLEVVRKRK